MLKIKSLNFVVSIVSLKGKQVPQRFVLMMQVRERERIRLLWRMLQSEVKAISYFAKSYNLIGLFLSLSTGHFLKRQEVAGGERYS